jgi:hypothetical protein
MIRVKYGRTDGHLVHVDSEREHEDCDSAVRELLQFFREGEGKE